MGKLISVIIPTYNAENTIQKAIESVQGQNIEIIIVIDGATDNTLKICQDIKNDNIKILEQENQGPFEARRTGINIAQGKYIMFLDSDDCFVENTISKIEEIIKKYDEPDLIRFRYKKEPNGYEQYKYMEEDEKQVLKDNFSEEVYPMFLNGYMLNALWTNCVKKEVIDKVNLTHNTVRYGEDLLLNLDIFSNIKNVVFINDVLYKYTYQENSITNSRKIKRLLNNLEDSVKVYTTLYTYLEKWGMSTKENIDIVNKRVVKESSQIIKIIKEMIQ